MPAVILELDHGGMAHARDKSHLAESGLARRLVCGRSAKKFERDDMIRNFEIRGAIDIGGCAGAEMTLDAVPAGDHVSILEDRGFPVGRADGASEGERLKECSAQSAAIRARIFA